MSGRAYPRIGRTSLQRKWEKLPPKGAPKCSACSQPARFRVEVQVNWFRGDDEVGNACPQHKGDAVAVLQGIEANQAAQAAQRAAAKRGSDE